MIRREREIVEKWATNNPRSSKVESEYEQKRPSEASIFGYK